MTGIVKGVLLYNKLSPGFNAHTRVLSVCLFVPNKRQKCKVNRVQIVHGNSHDPWKVINDQFCPEKNVDDYHSLSLEFHRKKTPTKTPLPVSIYIK